MSKGDLTKQRILEAAKEEFFEKGYLQTTISSITEKLGGRPSWVSYHFKYKDNIVSEIWDEFFNHAKKIITSLYPNIKEPMVLHFSLSILMLRIILSSEENIRFYYEAIISESNYRLMRKYITNTFTDIAEYCNLLFSEKETDLLIKVECAGRRELFLDMVSEDFKIVHVFEIAMQSYDFINLNISLMPRIMGIEPKTIESNIFLAWKINNAINLDEYEIKLLI